MVSKDLEKEGTDSLGCMMQSLEKQFHPASIYKALNLRVQRWIIDMHELPEDRASEPLTTANLIGKYYDQNYVKSI